MPGEKSLAIAEFYVPFDYQDAQSKLDFTLSLSPCTSLPAHWFRGAVNGGASYIVTLGTQTGELTATLPDYKCDPSSANKREHTNIVLTNRVNVDLPVHYTFFAGETALTTGDIVVPAGKSINTGLNSDANITSYKAQFDWNGDKDKAPLIVLDAESTCES